MVEKISYHREFKLFTCYSKRMKQVSTELVGSSKVVPVIATEGATGAVFPCGTLARALWKRNMGLIALIQQ